MNIPDKYKYLQIHLELEFIIIYITIIIFKIVTTMCALLNINNIINY